MIENVSNFDDESWGPKAEEISIWHFDPTIVDKEEDVFGIQGGFIYEGKNHLN